MSTNLENKNTVESKNQVSNYVFFEGKENGNPKIMFVGNSITLHERLESIGWYGNWGMAASKKENDYVHLVMADVLKKHPDASFCIVQAAIWERTYKNCDYEGNFASAKNFKPDIIICCLSANIPTDEFEHDAYVENLGKLHAYLSGGKTDVKIIQSSSFFNNVEKSEGSKAYCEKVGAYFVNISDISQSDENLAIDKFEHGGVQIHPGDKGMKLIAERIIETLDEVILK